MRSTPIIVLVALTVLGAFAACGGGVNSTDDAKKAYMGLDPSVDKAITLGFAGFNSATSANISPQSADGGQIKYTTDQAAPPALTINLKGIPTGTLDGSLNGSFMMAGALTGQVSLALSFTGQLQGTPDGGVERA